MPCERSLRLVRKMLISYPDLTLSTGDLATRLGKCILKGRSDYSCIVKTKPSPNRLQASVVQKVDSTIHRINLYPLDSAIGFPNIYPLDSDLSGGQRYPVLEQLGPVLLQVISISQ